MQKDIITKDNIGVQVDEEDRRTSDVAENIVEASDKEPLSSEQTETNKENVLEEDIEPDVVSPDTQENIPSSPTLQVPSTLQVSEVLPEFDKTKDILVHLLSVSGESMYVAETYSFSQSEPKETNYYRASQQIYPDDSIHILKLKIAKAVGDIYKSENGNVPNNYPSIESMYLFTRVHVPKTELDIETLYQEITKHATSELSFTKMKTFLKNFSLPFLLSEDTDMNLFLETIQQIIVDKNNTMEGVLQFVPMGFQYGKIFGNSTDYTFPVNPAYCTTEVFNEWQEKGWKPPQMLQSQEHQLLLRYLPMFQNEIYVCFSKDFPENIVPYYFPKKSQGSESNTLRMIEHMSKIDQTRSYMEIIEEKMEMVSKDLPRIDRQIKEFTLVMMNKTRIPLDILFKNISSMFFVPAIMYNPGKNKENILRLFSQRISKNGKRIPLLSKRQILTFCKFSKRQSIIYCLPKRSEDSEEEMDINDVEMYVMIDHHGNVHMYCDSSMEESMEKLNQLLRVKINPLLEHINAFLQKSGYMLPLFETVESSNIGLKHYHVRWSMRYADFFSIIQELPCIRHIFDVYEDVESSKETDNIVLKYKRVYSDYEGQGQLIKEFQYQGKNETEILERLVLNYSLTKEQAQRRIDKYEVDQEVRILRRNNNREYSFPVELHYENQQIVIDIYKYCRDCGRMSSDMSNTAENPEEYIVGRKGRIHKRNIRLQTPVESMDLPTIHYIELIESYMTSLLGLVTNQESLPKTDFCEKMVFELPAPDNVEEIESEEPLESLKLNPDEQDEAAAEEEEEIDEEEADVEEEEEEEDADEEDEDEGFLFGGVGKKRIKTRLDRLNERDPELFQLEGKDSYGRSCQKKRQPISLNQDEWEEVMKKDPDLRTVQYASTPAKKYWYACPKYWCTTQQRILTEEEYQQGICKDNVQFSDKYAYPGFEDPKKHPSELCTPCCFEGDTTKKNMHISRNKQCQEKSKETTPESNMEMDEEPSSMIISKNIKEDRVILKYSSRPPITPNRWSMLPKSLQYFFQVDYSKLLIANLNATRVVPNQPCFLLYGIEQPKKQSFMGLFTEIYNAKRPTENPVNVANFRNIFAEQMNLDRFVTYQNGAFLSVFGEIEGLSNESLNMEKYSSTRFYKTIDRNEPIQLAFLQQSIQTFENFLKYIQDTNTSIDHTYLWDIIADPGSTLIPGGCNLIVLELSDDEMAVDLLCPPSQHSMFDSKKESFFVLKRGNFYEPIYQLIDKEQSIEKRMGFMLESTTSTLRRILEMVDTTTHQYCAPVRNEEIMKDILKNLNATETERILKEYNYVIRAQLWNMEGKITGFYIHKQNIQLENGVIVPCLPSAVLMDSSYPVIYMSDTNHEIPKMPQTIKERAIQRVQSQFTKVRSSNMDLWKTYSQTLYRLRDVNSETKEQILCEPSYKIVDPIQNVVTGILTKTMQVVPVFPHEPPIEDDLPILKRSEDIVADQTLAMTYQGDPKREQFMTRISLETQFYQVFRAILRQLLNNFENRSTKKNIVHVIQEYEKKPETYSEAIMEISTALEQISREHIGFLDYSDDDLKSMANSTIFECMGGPDIQNNDRGEQKYCRGTMLYLPMTHLLYDLETCKQEGMDCSTKNIYFLRLADELLRFRRIQQFLFQPKTYLNITTGMSDYVLSPHEILILESFLNDDYFQDMIPFNTSEYIHQTNYDTSVPVTHLEDSFHPVVSLEEQQTMIRKIPKDIYQSFVMTECIVKKGDKETLVEGNNRSIWKRSFPKNTREIFFMDHSPICTFAVAMNLLRLAKQPSKTLVEIKQDLWKGYEPYMSIHGDKIIRTLKDQNKNLLLSTASNDLSTAIFTEDYFLTDLDWWILANVWKIPIVLFTSGKIKMTSAGTQPTELWLFLNTSYDTETQTDNSVLLYGSLWFIRSPLMVEQDKFPSYSLIESSFKIDELGEMETQFRNAMNMEIQSSNVQSLERFLQIKKVVRATRKKT